MLIAQYEVGLNVTDGHEEVIMLVVRNVVPEDSKLLAWEVIKKVTGDWLIVTFATLDDTPCEWVLFSAVSKAVINKLHSPDGLYLFDEEIGISFELKPKGNE